MIEYVFSLDDLARLRFAISPSWELAASLRALRDPASGAAHLPWLREVRDRLDGLDLRQVYALLALHDYTPDFLTPPPESPLTTIDDDLERLAATPVSQVRLEVGIVAGRRPSPELAAFARDPRRESRRLVRTLRAYWDVALAPSWPRILALLEADLQRRARRLAERGAEAILTDLHPEVRWTGERLRVAKALDRECVLGGRGLLLVPSAFGWQTPVAAIAQPWQPTVIYPARGVGLLWEEQPSGADGLAGVLGRTRADLLAALASPATTTQLAGRLGISPGGVSQHLSAMAAAGLLVRRRDGREVLYLRTPLGDALAAGTL